MGALEAEEAGVHGLVFVVSWLDEQDVAVGEVRRWCRWEMILLEEVSVVDDT